MDKVVIGSMRKSAGKTSMIVGVAGAMNKKMAYLKPFGERMLYRKKRLWDYDSALMTHIFGLKEDPVDMSIGFDHSKLRYMYDEEGTQQKLQESIAHVARDKEILFIEGGKDLTYGISVSLDTLSLTRYTASKLFIVVGGEEDIILDDILFLKKHIDMAGIHLGGIIVNKVQNLDAFQNSYLPVIHKTGVPVIGVIPYQSELTYFSVCYLADQLFAKVIAG